MVSHLTNNETYFFREQPQLERLRRATCCASSRSARRSRASGAAHVLSAGCSTGEEPLTLAMILFDSGQFFWGWDVQVTGLDVDEAALEKARRGLYHQNSLRAVTPPLLERHFAPDGSGVRVQGRRPAGGHASAPATCSSRSSYDGLAPLDVVFCRNVLIYFSDASMQRAVEHFPRGAGARAATSSSATPSRWRA